MGLAVLTINAGSSSLKIRLVGDDDELLATLDVDPWDGEAVPALDGELAAVDAVGHRVVHGGVDMSGPVRIDDAMLARIQELTALAPLHQPRCVAGIVAVRAKLPRTPTVACFDTAFHATLPPAAATYALPAAWRRRWPLRRFGFHGLSHQYAVRRAAELVGGAPQGWRVVTCHLGAGASLCATRGGRSVDTTMGFTPLEGLIMATRSGSVDPGLVLWLQTHGGLSATDVANGLERESGLAGLSGTSGDLRRIGTDDAGRLAVSVYVHRLRREIAAMAASLGGLDALVFTGGVGEHQPAIRATATSDLAFLGVSVDGDANRITSTDAEVTAAGAGVRTLVVTSREDLEIARQVRETLASNP